MICFTGACVLMAVLYYPSANIMGAVAAYGTTICVVLTHSGTVLQAAWFQKRLKNTFGWLDFSDTSRLRIGTAADIVPHWDVPKECKQRFWHGFWDILLSECGPREVARLEEMKLAVAEYGVHRVREHFAGAPSTAAASRLFVRRNLEVRLPRRWRGICFAWQSECTHNSIWWWRVCNLVVVIHDAMTFLHAL
jgi:hypothetical protein